jgi:nucleoside-diphosphate-sugar epimerase
VIIFVVGASGAIGQPLIAELLKAGQYRIGKARFVLAPGNGDPSIRVFYGPGTWYEPNGGYADLVRKRNLPIVGDGEAVWSWIHIDDAAIVTVAALDVPTGVYNIVDGDPCPVNVWLPAFAASIAAPPPPTLSASEALNLVGEDGVFYLTNLMGATNEKARCVFGFRPRRLEWLSDRTTMHA